MWKRMGKIVLLLFRQPGRRDAFNTLNSASFQVLMAKEVGKQKWEKNCQLTEVD